MAEKNWLALSWPGRFGGLAKGPVYEFILWNEVAYAGAARNPLASGIVAQTLIRYGSPQQQETWLPRIRAGEIHFSLCYSEPEAGSDLASLRVRADKNSSGSHYLLNGQKCWQSYAQDMDYLWVLARTGSQDSRGRGLSLFICDKQATGVTVSPLPTLDGDQLNEVYFDQVAVPLAQRVGEENSAWPIIGEALADERHIQFPPGRVRRDLDDMVAWLNANGLGADAVVRQRMAELTVRVMETEILGLESAGGDGEGSQRHGRCRHEQNHSHHHLPGYCPRGAGSRRTGSAGQRRPAGTGVAPEHHGNDWRRHLGNHAQRGVPAAVGTGGLIVPCEHETGTAHRNRVATGRRHPSLYMDVRFLACSGEP